MLVQVDQGLGHNRRRMEELTWLQDLLVYEEWAFTALPATEKLSEGVGRVLDGGLWMGQCEFGRRCH